MSVTASTNLYDLPQIKLNKFNKTINLVMSRIIRSHGYNITREQEAILRALCIFDGINQAELATRAGQERNNLSRTLTILEDKGLITRKVCTTDKRNSLVFVTPKGREVHAEVYKAIVEYRNILFAGMSMEEVEAFSETVNTLTANLNRYLDSVPEADESGQQ